ncbi:uncharacterized protein EI90DRAFT_3089786 [Cantharellus anzutake]|uniref:uncharacterized protein n=1 Tax=Cantharellus anzutake TaxID=1750568 RepID=UPI001902FCD2|nr:uncharacterized protein EI90DRAFT_3089786 [Cantharellus anzutake]KAF8314644.1 hypothetical protein EI90DRAFT_3089786 [Cantharellus anzutake]
MPSSAHLSSGYAKEQRVDDEAWHVAFIRYGGSARQLLDPSGEHEAKKYHHHLAEVNPFQDENGRLEVVESLAQYFYDYIREPSTPSTAGLMFETVGHFYILRKTKAALHVEAFSGFPVDKVPCLDAAKYYRPVPGDLPGIDSFAFERDENHTITGVVMFQYMISPRHPVKEPHINRLWDVLQEQHKGAWQWKIVFVIPKKSFSEQMLAKALATVLSQFVLEIDVVDMWETLKDNVDTHNLWGFPC